MKSFLKSTLQVREDSHRRNSDSHRYWHSSTDSERTRQIDSVNRSSDKASGGGYPLFFLSFRFIYCSFFISILISWCLVIFICVEFRLFDALFYFTSFLFYLFSLRSSSFDYGFFVASLQSSSVLPFISLALFFFTPASARPSDEGVSRSGMREIQ